MDIYSILSSKPHNSHYLNKYIRFINNCQHKNVNYQGYTERHHICPKSMFPDYKSFIFHPWNCAVLTARQHFIAHMLLWKTYKNKSTAMALWYMSNGRWKHYCKYSDVYHKLREELSETWKANGKAISKINLGMVVVKDKNNKIFRIKVDDPLYETREYVGHTKGKRVVLDENGNKFMSDDPRLVSFHKDMIPVKMPDGSIKKFHREDEIIKSLNFEGQFKDTIQVKDRTGNSFRVHKDDPRFLSGELTGVLKNRTTVRDKEGNTFSVDVDDPRLSNGELVGINSGKITITDGSRNKRIFDHEEIPLGWRRGMSRRKERKKKGRT